MLRDGLNYYCIDCWCRIEPGLASFCSTRCHDCRDGLTEPEPSDSGSVNPSEPWPAWFARTQGVPA